MKKLCKHPTAVLTSLQASDRLWQELSLTISHDNLSSSWIWMDIVLSLPCFAVKIPIQISHDLLPWNPTPEWCSRWFTFYKYSAMHQILNVYWFVLRIAQTVHNQGESATAADSIAGHCSGCRYQSEQMGKIRPLISSNEESQAPNAKGEIQHWYAFSSMI
jgi:hypothetical protein